jgi:hypothetical protein
MIDEPNPKYDQDESEERIILGDRKYIFNAKDYIKEIHIILDKLEGDQDYINQIKQLLNKYPDIKCFYKEKPITIEQYESMFPNNQEINELEDYEVKYWAIHADIYDALKKDPNKVYPTPSYVGLPDTNKLATQDKSHTIFNNKTNNLTLGIKIANESTTWNEPDYAYAARYPYNQVIETEAGHIVELDSTPNAERIHIYHKKGTYIEVDVNGSMVKKVMGDNFELIDNNGHLNVKGAYTMTVNGATKILIENNADIEVDGDVNVVGHGSTTVESAKEIGVIGKNIIVSGKESLSLVSDGVVNIQGSDITLLAKTGNFAAKASKDFAIQSGAASKMSVKGGLELLLDAAIIKEKMGAIRIF